MICFGCVDNNSTEKTTTHSISSVITRRPSSSLCINMTGDAPCVATHLSNKHIQFATVIVYVIYSRSRRSPLLVHVASYNRITDIISCPVCILAALHTRNTLTFFICINTHCISANHIDTRNGPNTDKPFYCMEYRTQ